MLLQFSYCFCIPQSPGGKRRIKISTVQRNLLIATTDRSVTGLQWALLGEKLTVLEGSLALSGHWCMALHEAGSLAGTVRASSPHWSTHRAALLLVQLQQWRCDAISSPSGRRVPWTSQRAESQDGVGDHRSFDPVTDYCPSMGLRTSALGR